MLTISACNCVVISISSQTQSAFVIASRSIINALFLNAVSGMGVAVHFDSKRSFGGLVFLTAVLRLIETETVR